jgi:hypothetical protein
MIDRGLPSLVLVTFVKLLSLSLEGSPSDWLRPSKANHLWRSFFTGSDDTDVKSRRFNDPKRVLLSSLIQLDGFLPRRLNLQVNVIYTIQHNISISRGLVQRSCTVTAKYALSLCLKMIYITTFPHSMNLPLNLIAPSAGRCL